MLTQDNRAQTCGASTNIIDLSRTSADQAQALCADGAVMVTDDGGKTWADDGTVKGGIALGNRLASNRLTTYVARVGGDCPGIDLTRVAKGKSPDSFACAGRKVPTQAVDDKIWIAGADLKSRGPA